MEPLKAMASNSAHAAEPVCRRVERERVECPRCTKALSIKTLMYKHAPFCRPLQDRVAERGAAAKDAYEEDFLAKNAPINLSATAKDARGEEYWPKNAPTNLNAHACIARNPASQATIPNKGGYTMEAAMRLLNF